MLHSLIVVCVHPLFEPCLGQILAFLEACPAGQADSIHLVVPQGRRNRETKSINRSLRGNCEEYGNKGRRNKMK